MPKPDIFESVRSLDSQRLGKQRVEGFQILNVAIAGQGAWYRHPATQMVKFHLGFLFLYVQAACEEWMNRGHEDTVLDKIKGLRSPLWSYKNPHWFGDAKFHRSHRSNLIRKYPGYYRDILRWDEPDDLPYVWIEDREDPT